MATKFGQKYVNHPTPKWVLIIQTIVEYVFTTIAAGTFLVPDDWTWWKYVVALSGFSAGLMTKLKPLFGDVTNFPVDENAPQTKQEFETQ